MEAQPSTSHLEALTEFLGGKRKMRETEGRAACHRILRRVNDAAKSSRVDRVVWLLEALIKAESLRLQLYGPASDHLLVSDHPRQPWATRWVSKSNPSQPPKYNPDRMVFTDPELHALHMQFKSLMREIEEKLKRYRWTPTVRCGGIEGGLGVRYIWPNKSAEDSWENWAVLWLIGHAAQESSGASPGLILRFRHCLQCGIWFYATTDHQKHCSIRCRRKFYTQSPEYRAERAKYMKKHRREAKERAARQEAAWKAAQKKGRKGA